MLVLAFVVVIIGYNVFNTFTIDLVLHKIDNLTKNNCNPEYKFQCVVLFITIFFENDCRFQLLFQVPKKHF